MRPIERISFIAPKVTLIQNFSMLASSVSSLPGNSFRHKKLNVNATIFQGRRQEITSLRKMYKKSKSIFSSKNSKNPVDTPI